MEYLSVIAIIRNPSQDTLTIWLDHYFWQGASHIYLIDRLHEDDDITSTLRQYIHDGRVTYYKVGMDCAEWTDVRLYRKMFVEQRMFTKSIWVTICEVDEFFFGTDRKLSIKLNELSPYFDTVLCNWLVFGPLHLTNVPFANLQEGKEGKEEKEGKEGKEGKENKTIPQINDVRIDVITRAPYLDDTTRCIFKAKNISSPLEINIDRITNSSTTRTRTANKLIRLHRYIAQLDLVEGDKSEDDGILKTLASGAVPSDYFKM